MDKYSFFPLVNATYTLPLHCVPCKNQNDAIAKAKDFKEKFHFDVVTIFKHITQV